MFHGYRAAFWLGRYTSDGQKHYHDAPLRLEGTSEIPPGGGGIAVLRPVCPEFWRSVAVGDRLEMCEGSRVVGVAVVLEIG